MEENKQKNSSLLRQGKIGEIPTRTATRLSVTAGARWARTTGGGERKQGKGINTMMERG